MKTAIVILQFQPFEGAGWIDVTESEMYGFGQDYKTLKDVVKAVQKPYVDHHMSHRILNIIVG